MVLTPLHNYSFICGTFGVFPLHALYPLMKRWTYWPQGWLGKTTCPSVLTPGTKLFIGLAMNWGLPTAWLIASPNDVESIPMWVLTFGTFWCASSLFRFPALSHDFLAGPLSTIPSTLVR